MLNFWLCLVTKKKDGCIDKTLYSHLFEMQQNRNNAHQWNNFIKNSLDELGLSYIFDSRNINPAWFKLEIKNRLSDAFMQDWSRDLCDNKACTNYKLFKKDFAMERYLIDIPWCLSYQLLRFQVRNIKPLWWYVNIFFRELWKILQSALFATRVVMINFICCSPVPLSGGRGIYWVWELSQMWCFLANLCCEISSFR